MKLCATIFCKGLRGLLAFAIMIVLSIIQTNSVAASSLPDELDSGTLISAGFNSTDKGAIDLDQKGAEGAATGLLDTPSGSNLSEDSAVAGQPSVSVAWERIPNRKGLWIDTGLLLGAQVGAVAVTYFLPESFSNWSDEKKGEMFKNYGNNFVDPVFDDDKLYVNYVLHPYWGSAYYLRARERGFSRMSSFAYSAAMSAAYEFGVECFFEKPSIQDLIVTPVAGSLLGAFIFEPIREKIKGKPELRWYDHLALAATDPIGLLSTGFERLFGIKSTVSVDYHVLRKDRNSSSVAPSGDRFQLAWTFPLR